MRIIMIELYRHNGEHSTFRVHLQQSIYTNSCYTSQVSFSRGALDNKGKVKADVHNFIVCPLP